MRSTTILAATALSTAVLAAGCGSSGPPPPPPDPLNGAPHVDKPLETAKFEQNPCSVLTPQQLQELNIGAQGEASPNSTGGPSCDWHDTDGPSKAATSVTFMTKNPAGLRFVYGNRQSYNTFREYPPIGDYPAISAFTSTSTPEQEGRCSVLTGVSDHLMIAMQVQFNRGQDKPADFNNPCGRAQQVAGNVVKTLKGEA